MGKSKSKFTDQNNNIQICLLGISFKPNTDDVRESPGIKLAKDLVRTKAKLKIYDPQGMDNAKKWDLRTSSSVDKNGVSDETGTGWGWFPGYAIDVSKGIRLDMMFSEDSSFPDQNGSDMIFNPSDEIWINQSFTGINLGTADWSTFSDISANQLCLGGKHWVFVLNTPYQGDDESLNTNKDLFDNWSLASRKKKLIAAFSIRVE